MSSPSLFQDAEWWETPRQIRTMHHFGFRSGEWADLLTVAPDPEPGRDCYVVRFADGATDDWVVDDPDGKYEFRAVESLV
jgi:hypothetical protein